MCVSRSLGEECCGRGNVLWGDNEDIAIQIFISREVFMQSYHFLLILLRRGYLAFFFFSTFLVGECGLII